MLYFPRYVPKKETFTDARLAARRFLSKKPVRDAQCAGISIRNER